MSNQEATIEIYLHTEGLRDLELIEVAGGSRVSGLLAEGEHLWAQDEDSPVEAEVSLAEAGIGPSGHVYRGRCSRVKVRVRFHGQDRLEEFPPSARLIRVYHWAVGDKGFELPSEQVPKHGLALPRGDEILDRELHIGSLVSDDRCVVDLDLVPRDRFAG